MDFVDKLTKSDIFFAIDSNISKRKYRNITVRR